MKVIEQCRSHWWWVSAAPLNGVWLASPCWRWRTEDPPHIPRESDLCEVPPLLLRHRYQTRKAACHSCKELHSARTALRSAGIGWMEESGRQLWRGWALHTAVEGPERTTVTYFEPIIYLCLHVYDYITGENNYFLVNPKIPHIWLKASSKINEEIIRILTECPIPTTCMVTLCTRSKPWPVTVMFLPPLWHTHNRESHLSCDKKMCQIHTDMQILWDPSPTRDRDRTR